MTTPDFHTPTWVHDAVFYQIFPDRFAHSAAVEKPGNLEPWDAPPTPYGFKGGDLLGIVERLDYLQDLGITAIYLNPIFQSASNHRYHTHDYYRVDPLLGGDAAFRRLLDEAHRRGIRIILDGVFNHASRGFFQFNHILEVGAQSPYLDWFVIHGFPLNAYEGTPNYKCWWNLPALPEFNHANPQVQRFIFDVARYWLEQGIDGWRLDVPFCVTEPGFWARFREVVKSTNPEAYITGEIPEAADPWLQGDQFDGVMNYLLTYACWGFFGGERLQRDLVGHWYDHGPDYFVTDATAFAAKITHLLERYPRPAVLAQLNLLDSHDTARFLTLVGGERTLLRLAVLFMLTYPGAPCVYYGDEIGLEGGQDPDCRRAFPWDERRWDHDLRAWYRTCIALRRAHPALRTGDFTILQAQGQVLTYLRRRGEDQAVVVLNRSAQTLHLDVAAGASLPEGSIWRDALGSGTAQVTNGHLHGLTLGPLSGAVLLPA